MSPPRQLFWRGTWHMGQFHTVIRRQARVQFGQKRPSQGCRDGPYQDACDT